MSTIPENLTPEDEAFSGSVINKLQNQYAMQFRGGIQGFTKFILSLEDLDEQTRARVLRVKNVKSAILDAERTRIIKSRS